VAALAQVIVSIIAAQDNSKPKSEGGYHSATFAAVWSQWMVIAHTYYSGVIAFGVKRTELTIGFMVGFSVMFSELLFVLAVAFLILGDEAKNKGYGTIFIITQRIFL
jgi:hypothetical protein